MKRGTNRTILVSGGGITGLTAALCLAKAGFRVEVFEKAEGFDTIGAGLQISPNALQVIEELGLLRRLKSVSVAPVSIRVMSAISGKDITAIPLGATVIERYGLPYLVAHRADLHQVLAGAAHDHPDITIHLGAQIKDFTAHANGVTALGFREGDMREYHAVAIVVADGVWSKLRVSHFHARPAVFSGLVAWRALIAADQLPGSRDLENTQLWLAPNAHAVSYPVRNGRYLNIVAITKSRDTSGRDAQEDWHQAAFASELKPALKGWSGEFMALLNHRARWTRWPLFRIVRTSSWTNGPAALAGDAAHAMLPFAAQGAAMGIEDAAVLANCLQGVAPSPEAVEEALKNYEGLRRKRVARTAKLSSSNQSIYHLPQPFSTARDLGMMTLGGYRLLARQNWLYDWRPDTP